VLPATSRHVQRSNRPPLHDVRHHGRPSAKAESTRIDFLTNEPSSKPTATIGRQGWLIRLEDKAGSAVWWSQTGSNRRPPACKAGALPTELWPLQKSAISSQRSELRNAAHDLPSTEHQITDFWSWWAWEDLNFRPHAYQARALTN
jgi:hypothetical protein